MWNHYCNESITLIIRYTRHEICCNSAREYRLISLEYGVKNKGKSMPLQALGGSRRLRLQEFLDIRHLKVVRLSALGTGCFFPHERFLVLISVRGWVDPWVIVRPQGLSYWKLPVTPSGIEPATFQLLAQCLNHLWQYGDTASNYYYYYYYYYYYTVCSKYT
jgi:hypothetical protein